jgi:hypothetical protein
MGRNYDVLNKKIKGEVYYASKNNDGRQNKR